MARIYNGLSWALLSCGIALMISYLLATVFVLRSAALQEFLLEYGIYCVPLMVAVLVTDKIATWINALPPPDNFMRRCVAGGLLANVLIVLAGVAHLQFNSLGWAWVFGLAGLAFLATSVPIGLCGADAVYCKKMKEKS